MGKNKELLRKYLEEYKKFKMDLYIMRKQYEDLEELWQAQIKIEGKIELLERLLEEIEDS